MENNLSIPFERNRYYTGKLLTSADFQTEQTYINQKRRFFNRMTFGEGVVCGLGVFSLDDASIMVESGICIDGLGREIVIENAIMRKLSTIDGFRSLESGRALLCLQYTEEPVCPVYAMRGQETGDSYECNRIREGYRLLLQDVSLLETTAPAQPEFLAVGKLFSDPDFEVTITLPMLIACGSRVRMVVTVTRKSEVDALFSMSTTLQTPALTAEDGLHELSLQFDSLHIPMGESVSTEYWLTAQSEPAPNSMVITGAEGTVIRVGESERALPKSFMLHIAVEDITTQELVARAVGSMSLESHNMVAPRDFVPLAILTMQQSRNLYLIEEIVERGVKRYLSLPADADLIGRYNSWFAQPVSAAKAAAQPSSSEDEQELRYQELIYASGVCEIALGATPQRGQIFRSGEILHGLGKGNVMIHLGVEYLAEDARLGCSARNTIYGDPFLFAEEEPPISFFKCAAKVMNDRGSFTVAIRLTGDTVQSVATLRWTAIKLPAGNEDQSKLQRMVGKSIAAVQPTVVLEPRSSHYFSVRFKNMDPCELCYELTEKDSGEITSDGIYTAPAKDGVYEIRISSSESPLICTYAYAVVKRRATDDAAH